MSFRLVLIICCILLFATTLIQSQKICKSLNALAKFKELPDGLSGEFFQDLKWINSLCTRKSPINYESNWENVPLSSLEYKHLPSTITVSRISVKRTVSISFDEKNLNFEASIQLKSNLQGILSGMTINNLTTTHTFTKKIDNLPIESTDDAFVVWNGKLSTEPTNQLRIEDLNLFDRQYPALFLVESSSRSKSIYDDYIERLVSNGAKYIMSMESVKIAPSSLHAPSIRSSFLTEISNLVSKSQEFLGKVWIPKTRKFSESGVLVQKEYKCSKQECPERMIEAIHEILDESTKSKCSNLKALQNSLESKLTFDIFVGSQQTIIRGLSVSTQGLYLCNQNDTVSLYLSSTSYSQDPFSTMLLLSSNKTMIGSFKSLFVNNDGFINGKIHSDKDIFSSLRGNLFKDEAAGVFIKDFIYPRSNMVLSMIEKIKQTLITDIDLHNQNVESIFEEKRILAIYNEYIRETHVPTFFGFLYYLKNQIKELKMNLDKEGKNAYLHFVIETSSEVLNVTDRAIIDINEKLYNFGVQIDQQEDITKSLFNSISTIGVLMENLDNPTKIDVQIFDKLKISASVQINADLLNITASYNYHTKQISLIYGDKMLNTKDELVPSFNINPTIISSSIEKIYTNYLNQSWLSKSLSLTDSYFGLYSDNLQWDMMLENLMRQILSQKPTNSLTLKIMIEKYLTQQCSNVKKCKSVLSTFVTPIGTSQNLQLDISFDRMNDVKVQSSSGSIFSKISRTQLKLLSRVNIMCQFLSNDISDVQYSIKGSSLSKGFSIPMKINMISALPKASSFNLDLNIPSKASILIENEIITTEGKEYKAIIKSSNLLNEERKFETFIQGLESHLNLSPLEVIDETKEKILKFPEWDSLHLTLPLLTKPLDILNNINQQSEQISQWLSTAENNQSPLVMLTVNEETTSIPHFDVTINDRIYSCPISRIDQTSPENVAESINQGLTKCGLSISLIATIPSNDTDEIALMPKFTSSWIWNIHVNFTEQPSNLNTQNGNHQNVFAIFETWEEYSWILRGMTGSSSSTPEKVIVKSKDIEIPNYLLHIFPPEFKTTVVPLEFSLKQMIENVPMKNEFKDINETLKVQLVNPEATNIKSVSFLKTKIGNLFVEGLNNITIFTSTDGENITLDTPIQGFNYFKFGIQAQHRTASSKEDITFEKDIYIPNGLSLRKGLMEWLPTQIPENLKSMLTFSIVNGSFVLGTVDQIQIELSRSKLEDDSYLLPISMSIKESIVPGLNNSEHTPSSSLLIFVGFSFINEYQYIPKATESSGSLGIFNMFLPKVGGKGFVTVKCLQTKDIISIDKIRILEQDNFEQFEIDIISNVTIHFPNAEVNVTNNDLPSIDKLSLVSENEWKITSEHELNKTQNEIDDLRSKIESKDDETVESYEKLSSVNNVCSFMDHFMQKINEIKENRIFKATIPLISKTGGEVIDKTLNEKLNLVKENVCQEIAEISLTKLCSLLSNTWNQIVCTNITVGVKSFEVGLKIDAYSYSLNDAMNIDRRLLGGKLPAMVGAEKSILVSTKTSIDFIIGANWQSGNLRFEIKDGASLNMNLQFKLEGNVKAIIGPLSIGLMTAKIAFGNPEPVEYKVILRRNKPIDVKVLGNAEFSSMIRIFGKDICEYSLTIPDLDIYFKEGSGIVIDQRTCFGGSLERAVSRIFEQSSLLTFFRDPGTFLLQWRKGVNTFIQRLFTVHTLQKLLRFSAPLIKFAIPRLVETEIRKIAGEKITNELTKGISDVVQNVLENNQSFMNRTVIEQAILRQFTKLMCDHLPLRQCPEVPNVHSDRFQWKLPFEKKITKTISKLDFELGRKSSANLESKCKLDIEMVLGFNIVLVFTRSNGFSFEFEDGRVLESRLGLPLSNCKLSGLIGILGAELSVKPGANFEAILGVNIAGNVWSGMYQFSSIIEAEAKLGLVGKVKEMVDQVQNPIDQFLHFQLDMKFEFFHSLERTRKPKLTVGKLKLCMGNYISRITAGFRDQVNRILQPLDNILGRNGFLMKKLPPTRFIYGRELTVAEYAIILARSQCRGSCRAENVERLIRVYQRLLEIHEILQKLKPILDPKMCATFKFGRSFSVDFENPDAIQENGDVPSDELQFEENFNPQDEIIVRRSWSNIETGEGFKIKFPITARKIPELLIKAIMGIHFDLMEVQMPHLKVEIHNYFPITVYCCFPKVDVFFAVTINIHVKPPDMVFSTEGIHNAITSRKVLSLLRGIQFIVQNPDGSPIPLAQGSFRITAGATVKLLIFEGTVYFYFEAVVTMNYLSINGGPRVRFDELRHLPRSLSFNLKLNIGFGLYIRACIRIRIFRIRIGKCWTIVHWKWGPRTIFERTWGAVSGRAALRNGDLNLDKIQENNGGSFVVNNDFVLNDDNSNSVPPLSAPQTKSVIGYTGNSNGKQYEVEQRSSSLIILPPTNAKGYIDLSIFNEISSISISKNQFTPNEGTRGFQYQTCVSFKVDNPHANTAFTITGIPCEYILDITSSNVVLNGNIEDYLSRSFMLNNDGDIISKIPFENIVVTKNKLIGNGIEVFTYNNANSLEINGHNEKPSKFYIEDTNSFTSITLIGGNYRDEFYIRNLLIPGALDINGGNDVNSAFILVNTPSKNIRNLNLMITGSLITASDGQSIIKNVQTNNIVQKNLNIIGSDQTNVQLSVVSLSEFDSVNIITENSPNGKIYLNLTTCNSGNIIRVELKGSGDQTIYISQGGIISNMNCHIYIYGIGNENSKYSVVLDADQDERPLQATFTGSTISIIDPYNSFDFNLRIIINNVPKVIFNFSKKIDSQLILLGTPKNVDYKFNFPNHYFNRKQTAYICQTDFGSNILITGVVNARVGPDVFRCNSPQFNQFNNPLEYLKSVVAFSGPNSGTEKVLLTMNSMKNGPQYFKMDYQCLIATDINGNRINQLLPASIWMKDQLQSVGIPRDTSCELIYTPNTSSFHIETGNGDDIFISNNIKSNSLFVNVKDGINLIEHENSLTPVKFESGNGGSKFKQTSPTGYIELDMIGGLNQRNVIEFHVKQYQSNVYGQTFIRPIGPNSSIHYANLTHHKDDLVTVIYGK